MLSLIFLSFSYVFKLFLYFVFLVVCFPFFLIVLPCSFTSFSFLKLFLRFFSFPVFFLVLFFLGCSFPFLVLSKVREERALCQGDIRRPLWGPTAHAWVLFPKMPSPCWVVYLALLKRLIEGLSPF